VSGLELFSRTIDGDVQLRFPAFRYPKVSDRTGRQYWLAGLVTARAMATEWAHR
jgi:hypothetical protein